MNRFTPGVPVVLVLGAWSVAALADDTPTAAAPVTATAASSATATPPASPSTSSTSSSSNTSMQRLVCLNMSLQCFAVKPKTEGSSAKAQPASLDLKAPDIRRVATPMQLQEQDETIDIEDQQVQVQGTRPEVYVPGGLASLPWAVMHPTQAWRIFLPVSGSQTK